MNSTKGEMRSVVLKAFEQVQATGGMTLFRSHRPEYADGEQLRDFVYVKDAVAMTLFFLNRPEAKRHLQRRHRPGPFLERSGPGLVRCVRQNRLI